MVVIQTQAFIVTFVTCKNEEDPFKNECTRVIATFLPLQVYGDFLRHSRAANSAVRGRISSKFKLVQAFMLVLDTCRNKEDQIKIEGARVVTTVYIYF